MQAMIQKSWFSVAVTAAMALVVACDANAPADKAHSSSSSSSSASASASASASSSSSAPSSTPDQASGRTTLFWGTIADNPQEEQDKLDEWGKFLAYMKGHLSVHGVGDVKLVFCHSPQEMADWIHEGKVDLFDESPFGAYLVNQLGKADEPLLNRWKNGNEKFGSVIFSRRVNGIESLDQLKGKMMAFRGDTSTANYFRPKVYLAKRGYRLTEKKNYNDPVAPGEIGYFFVWSSRDKLVETVMDGKAVAGGVSDEFVDQLLGKDVGPAGSARHPRDSGAQATKEDLRILARVPPVLRRLVTVRKGLNPGLKSVIKDLLLKMHESPEGRAVLATFGPSTRFSVADTDEIAYQGILDQGALVQQEVKKFSRKP